MSIQQVPMPIHNSSEMGLEWEPSKTYWGHFCASLSCGKRERWLAAWNGDYPGCSPGLCSSRQKLLLRAECRLLCNYFFTTPVCSWADTRVDKWYRLLVRDWTEMQFKINSARAPLGTASRVVFCTGFSRDLTVWDNECSLFKMRILYFCPCGKNCFCVMREE